MKNRWLIGVVVALAPWCSGADPPKLEYTVILSRHGVRSPTWELGRLNEYSAAPWPDWGVPPGDLTPHGGKLIELLGTYYRQWFLQEGLLGNGTCREKERLYVWADTNQRTLATGRAFADSIFPGCDTTVHSATGARDPVFSGLGRIDPQTAAKDVLARLGPHPKQIAEQYRPALETLQFILEGGGRRPNKVLGTSRAIGVTAGDTGIELLGPFATASTLSEDFLLEYADGMGGANLGWGRLTKESLSEIFELHRFYADLMRRTQYLARARGSNLLAHVLASLEQAVSGRVVPGAFGSPGTALLILAGHDTNQSNISGMLDLAWKLPDYPQEETPPGGALIFTLWHNADGGRFVRLQYLAASLDQMHNLIPLTLQTPPQSAPVRLKSCAGPDCTWQEFARVVAGVIDLSAVDWNTR